MNIALLFDSTLPEYAGFYKWPINNKVFSTGIIQASGRHMKIWIGDVSTYSTSRRTATNCVSAYISRTHGVACMKRDFVRLSGTPQCIHSYLKT